MATLCKNCGHALVFDPTSQKLVCDACASTFAPEEIEAEAMPYREDLEAVSAEEAYGEKNEDTMDCYVYTCSECGGSITIDYEVKAPAAAPQAAAQAVQATGEAVSAASIAGACLILAAAGIAFTVTRKRKEEA